MYHYEGTYFENGEAKKTVIKISIGMQTLEGDYDFPSFDMESIIRFEIMRNCIEMNFYPYNTETIFDNPEVLPLLNAEVLIKNKDKLNLAKAVKLVNHRALLETLDVIDWPLEKIAITRVYSIKLLLKIRERISDRSIKSTIENRLKKLRCKEERMKNKENSISISSPEIVSKAIIPKKVLINPLPLLDREPIIPEKVVGNPFSSSNSSQKKESDIIE